MESNQKKVIKYPRRFSLLAIGVLAIDRGEWLQIFPFTTFILTPFIITNFFK